MHEIKIQYINILIKYNTFKNYPSQQCRECENWCNTLDGSEILYAEYIRRLNINRRIWNRRLEIPDKAIGRRYGFYKCYCRNTWSSAYTWNIKYVEQVECRICSVLRTMHIDIYIFVDGSVCYCLVDALNQL